MLTRGRTAMIYRAHATQRRPGLAFLLVFTLTLLGSAVVAEAQAILPYDHSTFLNGFGSDPSIWQKNYNALNGDTPPTYINRSVVLKTVGLFNVNIGEVYNQHIG